METWAGDERGAGRYWNGDESAHWLVQEERHEHMLALFTGHLPTSAGGIALAPACECGRAS